MRCSTITRPRIAPPMALCNAPTNTSSRKSRRGRKNGSATTAKSSRWRKKPPCAVSGKAQAHDVVDDKHRPRDSGDSPQGSLEGPVWLG